MLAVKSMDVRENFKEWCNKVIGGETLVVSRPRNENVVIISEKEYNEMAKLKRNAEYLSNMARGYAFSLRNISITSGHVGQRLC